MKRMMLFYDPVILAQVLDLLQTRGSPPALETVYIRLHKRKKSVFLQGASSRLWQNLSGYRKDPGI